MDGLARRFGCTEGQLYTVLTGIVLATILAWSGVSTLPPLEGFLPTATAPNETGAMAATPPPTGDMPLSSAPAGSPVSDVPTGATFGSGAATPAAPTETDAPAPSVFARVGDPGAPAGLAVTPDGRVFVSTDNGKLGGKGASHVFGFGSDGSTSIDIAVSGQPEGHARGVTAIAAAPDGTLAAADASTSRILRVDPQANALVSTATIPNLQPCVLPLNVAACEPGMADDAPLLTGVVFDGAGNLFVADAGQATVWKVAAGAAKPWYQSADLAGGGPAGLALDASGNVLLTATATTDPQNGGKGGLYRIVRNADGSAGARTLVVSFAAEDVAGPVAVSPSGTAYVGLGAGGIVAVADGAASPLATDASPIPLDGPGGLAVVDDRLLVTNRSASDDPDRWAVLSFPIS